ncbi:hypothetical protein [Streptomyces mirabilis]|uniref:hypothetical protein n=1 Tax=Streptomyces mirabilis TaxID=68239 RepID=UPI003689D4C0
MTDPAVLERIATRRSELDGLEEQLAKQLEGVHAARDELVVAEKVPARLREKVAAAQATTAPVSAQVGGSGAPPVPHRAPGVDKGALPPEHQRILAVVQQAAGPVMPRHVGKAPRPTPRCGAPWSRCAGSRPSWPTAAGSGSLPTGSSPPGCERNRGVPGGR